MNLSSFFFRPGSWSTDTCDESIIIPYSSLAFMLFEIMTGSIVGVDSFARCMFTSESAIYSVYFPG